MTKQVFLPGNLLVADAWGKAELKFNVQLENRLNDQVTDAQKFVDSEVLRRCEPYIPKLTGILIASGITGTVIGSGYVQWITPYARRQYMSARAPGSATGPLRGPHWFERMKAVDGDAIIDGAKKKFGES